jgi:hypothetical protein
MIRGIAADAIVMAATPVLADGCSGTLRRDADGLFLAAGKPEGVCEIARADERRVLRSCLLDQHCTVDGRMRLCTDVGSSAS